MQPTGVFRFAATPSCLEVCQQCALEAFVLMPDDIELPALDPALAAAHMRLLRAVQTGCSIAEYDISMVRNRAAVTMTGH